MLDSAYLPDTIPLYVGNTRPLPPALAKPAAPEVAAWICEGATCLAPLHTQADLRDRLQLPRISPSTRNNPPRSPA
jgi:uncharacterized protein YyaL (SSP411 family)